MAVRPVVLFPDPILKQRCDEINNPLNPGSQAMLQDLHDTFYANPGVGLAAPQIGLPWRIIIVDTRRHPKFGDDSHGLLQLFNPVILESSGKRVGREGCLSIPDYIVRVPRKEKIIVQAVDENDIPVTVRATGFEAVCLQHEIDHLDGILIFDRIRSIRSDLFRRGANS